MLRLTGMTLLSWRRWISSPTNKVYDHTFCGLEYKSNRTSPPPPKGHFPPPTTTEELGARILIQERYEKYGESEEVEMEVESEDEDDHRDHRNEVHPSQPDQDTQLQDMDEVRAQDVLRVRIFKCFGTCGADKRTSFSYAFFLFFSSGI